MKRLILIAGGILCLTLAATPAPAAIQVRDAVGGEQATGFPPGLYLTGTGARPRGTHTGGSPQNLQTGTFEAEADYGAGFVPLLTYCVQGVEEVGWGVNPPDNVGIMLELQPLTFHPEISAGEAAFIETLWFHAFATSQTSRVDAAAFQTLVWENVTDNSIDFSSGQFQLDTSDTFTSQVSARALEWRALIEGGVWNTRTPLLLLTGDGVQDVLTPVPEPASALGLALLGLAALRRR